MQTKSLSIETNPGNSARKWGGAFLGGVSLMLAYTTWFWAGIRPSFHWVGVVLAGMLMAGAIGFGTARRAWGRDPLVYLGLAFLMFLAIQWFNAGRVQYFDVGFQQWRYTPPRWPNWPSAFSRPEAGQMLTWFFPAWVVALVIRSRLLSGHELRMLMTFLVGNAGLLALFGIVQFASGTSAIYWRQPLREPFFASFGYGNHAAPFFVLSGALAAGLLYREVFDSRSRSSARSPGFRLHHPWRSLIHLAAFLLCLAGANLGLSRTGVILAAVLGVFVAGYGGVRGWRVLSAGARVNFLALTLGGAGVLYFLVAGFGGEQLRQEFRPKSAPPGMVMQTPGDRLNLELGHRPLFIRAALAAWREQPWFGLGGWGFKYRVADHVSPDMWPALVSRGWANVHVDALQYLAEFGVVGMGLLLSALGWMLRDWLRPPCWREALGVMGAAGLALVVGFSLIDLPFRCPAILYTWVAVLAAVPRIIAIPFHTPPPSVSWNFHLERSGP